MIVLEFDLDYFIFRTLFNQTYSLEFEKRWDGGGGSDRVEGGGGHSIDSKAWITL